MTRLADRRTILLAAAAAVTVAVMGAAGGRGWSGSATAHHVDVTIAFEGGGPLPKGRLVVYLDAAADRPMPEIARLYSDGGRETASLSLPVAETSSPRQIVAELQRPDGWLLARGSTQIEPGLPAAITLYTVLYQQ